MTIWLVFHIYFCFAEYAIYTVYMWTLLLVIYDVANYNEYENVQIFISIQITIGSYDPPAT